MAAGLAVLLWGLFGIPSAIRQPAARPAARTPRAE
jgi:hypothetical protein